MMAESALSSLPETEVDRGTFKYVLMEVLLGSSSRLILRGRTFASYHDDIVQHTRAALAEDARFSGAAVRCTGGGRIRVSDTPAHALVYGYSVAYGKGDHAAAAEMLRRALPRHSVEWSDEGY